MNSLSWHLRVTGRRRPSGPGVSMEEMVAARRRVTGADDYVAVEGLDRSELDACYAELLEQRPRLGDWGPAYLGALARNRGDRAAADAEMRRAFGRTVSRPRAWGLHRRWRVQETRRRAAAEQFFAAHPELPEEMKPRRVDGQP